MPVPTLNLTAHHQILAQPLRQAFDAALASGHFILGPAVQGFEAQFAAFCGSSEAVGVSSGTDALLLALMALEIKPGDEVIVPTFTFFATAGCVARLGAKPVFVDVRPDDCTIDLQAVERAITPRTRAVIPVHLYGHMADMDGLRKIAQQHHLHVVEDAAQAIGASQAGKRAATFGDIGCTSFYPTKNLSALGDAGACLTSNADIAARLRTLRVHGMAPKYHHHYIGGNFRMDALQAAFLAVKLHHLPQWLASRRQLAQRYNQLLANLPVTLPCERPGFSHAYNYYTIRVPAQYRPGLCDHLRKREIGHDIYYPIPLHLQACFAYLGGRQGDCPQAERACAEVVSLPLYPELTQAQQDEVARAVREYFHG